MAYYCEVADVTLDRGGNGIVIAWRQIDDADGSEARAGQFRGAVMAGELLSEATQRIWQDVAALFTRLNADTARVGKAGERLRDALVGRRIPPAP